MQLERLASHLEDIAGFLSNPHTGFNRELVQYPVQLLWDRYFKIRLMILKVDPQTYRMNQGERAQRIQQEMQKISVTERSIKTISRWDGLKMKDLINENSQ